MLVRAFVFLMIAAAFATARVVALFVEAEAALMIGLSGSSALCAFCFLEGLRRRP